MEVNGLTLLPTKQFTNQVSTSFHNPIEPAEMPPAGDGGGMRYESITMDLEEMKNFLFMMIRGGAVTVESEENKIGRIINKFA